MMPNVMNMIMVILFEQWQQWRKDNVNSIINNNGNITSIATTTAINGNVNDGHYNKKVTKIKR